MLASSSSALISKKYEPRNRPLGRCMNDEQRVAIEAGPLCVFLRTGKLVKRCERGSDVHRPVKMWGSAVRLTYVLGIRAVKA